MSRWLILIYELFLMNTTFRFRTKSRHLTYWLKWRFHLVIIGGSIVPDGVVFCIPTI